MQENDQQKEKIVVVGLGYVGLPLAVLLAKHFSLVGFDINEKRIKELQSGIDHTREVSSEELKSSSINFSSNPEVIKDASFVIVAVPTPVDSNRVPDLTILEKATETVGNHISKGAVVVYESTVYPGATEEVCIPILEQTSGLSAGIDFKVGYSPERVNPGDKKHTIDKVTKVVSGMDGESLERIDNVYGSITNTYRATSIKVAEAAKVIENTQRDLNIALMNELAILFHKIGISVYDVLDAAGTKWNFLPFKPGLVGGHCIGVDPYYLTYKAQSVGHNPEVILAGRGINDSMHKFLAHQVVKEVNQLYKEKELSELQVVILGLTFKENISDIRNSKVAGLYKELKDFGLSPVVYDPMADHEEVQKEYDIVLTKKEELPKADVLIVAVAHDEFVRLSADQIKNMMNGQRLLLFDIKHLYDRQKIEEKGILYWTL